MTDHLFIFALSVFLAGVFGADVVSVKEGGSVTLHINPDEIQKAADLLWMFHDEETFIAQMDRETHETSIPGNTDERFRDRLQVDDQTGSLNITDVRTTDSGLYKLQISRSSGISYKTFDVTVTAVTESSQTSPCMITGPVLSITLVLMLLMKKMRSADTIITHPTTQQITTIERQCVPPDGL
ncbi:putative SLAM family member 6 [Triplophysa rosa]|uniref:SLAM family member 6 n=1 Tax=Triplophysa rosa TaxID=992332 RepID=A0A9W7T8H5_TRIRA|nr:putative SLAM family member 6 [Triplophysa rosa]